MNGSGLDFEKPVLELERKIKELTELTTGEKMDFSSEIKRLEKKLEEMKEQVYRNITPWQRVQIARHPQRPTTLDYVRMIAGDFFEFHGDRLFSDDPAIVGGLIRLEGEKIMLIGHQKGHDTKENLHRNFGSAHPEGYRKAIRLMKLAEKFGIPVVCFIDTPGAYPGVGAEERGQAEAIAENLKDMSLLKTPVVVLVIGEGGSGGALGIGVGDRICVLENAYYSVISPEGCAAILWRDRAKAPAAATALKLTARELLELKVIDEVIPEPLGGAHRHPETCAAGIKAALLRHLQELKQLSPEQLREGRYMKFRRMGVFVEEKAEG